MKGDLVCVYIYIYILSRDKILHTRNQHLRNHRGLPEACPMDFQRHVQTQFHCSVV